MIFLIDFNWMPDGRNKTKAMLQISRKPWNEQWWCLNLKQIKQEWKRGKTTIKKKVRKTKQKHLISVFFFFQLNYGVIMYLIEARN